MALHRSHLLRESPRRHRALPRRQAPPFANEFLRLGVYWILRSTAAIVVLTVVTHGVLAEAEAVDESINAIQDKSRYHLFNPTPAGRMREMSTDRPDKTESPYTVDAGHVQLEMDLANVTLDLEDGVRTRTWNIAPVNFKVGLLNNADLQVVFDSYLHEQVVDDAAQTRETTSGVGDVNARLKINLWGNDGGLTSFAMMPFMKVPTHSRGLGNNAVEGGVIFPLAVALPGKWDMGLMTEFDFLRNEAVSGDHTEFINLITFGHDIVGKLGGYVEFYSNVSTERGSRWVGTVDLGLTYGLTENIQLDAGCNIGVTRSADDLQPFLGLSVRF